MNRITAQVAVEAIVNHPDDGWETSTMEAVYRDAVEHGVPALYVDLLDEALASRRAVEAAFSGRSDGGDAGPERLTTHEVDEAWIFTRDNPMGLDL